MDATPSSLIVRLMAAVERLVPEYLADPVQLAIGSGNLALVIIDEDGHVHGQLFGTDKIRQRNTYRIAWTKASQVWITGMKTGEFERRVFSGELDPGPFGIIHPDFIGWEGGQPLELAGRRLAVGFSGLTGDKDLEIVARALQAVSALS